MSSIYTGHKTRHRCMTCSKLQIGSDMYQLAVGLQGDPESRYLAIRYQCVECWGKPQKIAILRKPGDKE